MKKYTIFIDLMTDLRVPNLDKLYIQSYHLESSATPGQGSKKVIMGHLLPMQLGLIGQEHINTKFCMPMHWTKLVVSTSNR